MKLGPLVLRTKKLFARRQERALARWSKVLPNDEPATAKSDQVFVLGNVPKARVEELVKQLDKAIAAAPRRLTRPRINPLVKGGIALFVLKSRYDYGEFGRMTESRELPKEWQGHWKADPLDVLHSYGQRQLCRRQTAIRTGATNGE